jgi:hypothetical protein
MARVDVIVTAYNAATTLGAALESLLSQNMRDMRVIVVDDGSTDGTAQILAGFAANDERVTVVAQPNRGIVDARNEALRHCSAEYVAILDADDIALPGRLERQLAYMQAHPACIALGGAVEHVDEAGTPVSGFIQPGPPAAADAAKAPALEPYIIPSTMLARRADLLAAGGYRHVPNSEDSDLCWRLRERGQLVNAPDVFAQYRMHSGSVSSSIVGARAMAVGSQLGALSALRRKAGRTDLAFTLDLLPALKQAQTLDAMTAIASKNLDRQECEHLRLAAGAKLMEMARYRPYELDAADCAFIRAALPIAVRLSPANQKELVWYVTVTAARLMRKGMWREALTLTPLRHLPVVLGRLATMR